LLTFFPGEPVKPSLSAVTRVIYAAAIFVSSRRP
jgi:hypothetical protein